MSAGLLPVEYFFVAWNDSTIDPSRVPSGKALKKLVVLGVLYEIVGDATRHYSGRSCDGAARPYADDLIDRDEQKPLPGWRSRNNL